MGRPLEGFGRSPSVLRGALVVVDHIGPKGRLKANHIRHHVKKGIVRAGCELCMLGGGPPAVAEPVMEPLLIENPPIETPVAVLTDVGGPISPQKNDELYLAKRDAWKSNAWSYASTGLPESVVIRLLNCPSPEFFHAEIKELFAGSWQDVVSAAMLSAFGDIQTAAIRRAKSGDFRGLLALQREGLCSVFGYAKQHLSESASELRKLTPDKLLDRFRKAVEGRGLQLGELSPTLTVEEPKEGDGLNMAPRITADDPLPIAKSSSSAKEDLPVMNDQSERMRELEERIEMLQRIHEGAPSPVIACPPNSCDGVPPASPVIARPQPGMLVIREQL